MVVFDLLALGLLAWGLWYARTSRAESRGRTLLPPEDQPPPAAEEALPHGRRLNQYVEGGLVEIDDYLRRHEAA